MAATKHWISIFLVLVCTVAGSQSILNKNISVSNPSTPINSALKDIEKAGDFYFSYNPNHLPTDSIVSLEFENKKVRLVLDQLFDGRLIYKESGRHLILQPNPKYKKVLPVVRKKTTYRVTGYIVDKKSGNTISKVTVYDVDKKNTTVTNAKGYYELELNTNKDFLGIRYSNSLYYDTIVVIQPDQSQSLNIEMTPNVIIEKIEPKPLTVEQSKEMPSRDVEDLALVKWVVPESQLRLSANILESFDNIPAQISLVPKLGTNNLISGAMINNFSLNLLAGYAHGVNGIEVGGLVNVIKDNVNGLQASGLSNVVGGDVNGLQVSGLSNNVRGSIRGLQAAGFSNIVLDTIHGVQVSGFSNVIRGGLKGAQIAGFSNVSTQNVDGLQLSGFSNVAFKDVLVAQGSGFMNLGRNVGGLQAAGFTNIARGTVSGAQVAGFVNVGKHVNASQIAGFINVAKKVNGVQIAGFINVAKEVGGSQIGFINIADTLGGASIGFFNFVRKGYHKVELGTTDAFTGKFAFKTGTRYFYNIFSTGAIFDAQQKPLWGIGYGLGTEPRFNKKLVMNIDITGHLMLTDELFTLHGWEENGTTVEGVNWNAFTRLDLNLGVPLFKERAFLFGGPSVNVYFASEYPNQRTNFPFAVDPAFRDVNDETATSAWIGWQVGLRF